MKQVFLLIILLAAGNTLSSQTTTNSAPALGMENLTFYNVASSGGKMIFEGNSKSYAALAEPTGIGESGTWIFNVNIKQASTGAGQSIISKTEAIGSYSGIHIFEDSGRLALQIKNNTNNQTLNIKSDHIAGTGFHCIAITYQNNGVVKLFIDGQLKKEAKAPYFIFSKNPLRLGCSMDPYWKAFNGEIGAPEIFSSILTDEEIINHSENKINKFREIDPVIYPNPAQNLFNIRLPAADKVSIILIDSRGNEVYRSERTSAKELVINTEKLASGIYYLHLNGSKNYSVKKLVITKK